MSNAGSASGWLLHSRGRHIGPLTEAELRGYFRAGIIESTYLITAPGESTMRAAEEVAISLGEKPPAGPPPEPVAPKPPVAVPTKPAEGKPIDPELEARKARALAAMNVDFSVLAASSAPRRSSGGRWVVALLVFLALIAVLMFALSSVRKMRPSTSAAVASAETQG